jgi:hypothetical protein
MEGDMLMAMPWAKFCEKTFHMEIIRG